MDVLKYIYKINQAYLLLFFLMGCSAQEIVENKLAADAYNQGRYLTAITYCNEALNKNPDNYFLLMIRGKSNLKLENYSESINDFSSCINLNDNYEPRYYRARAFLESGKLEDCSKDLLQALKFDPQNEKALFDYAYAQTLLEDYDSAIEAYKKVIEIDSLNSNAYVNIGNLLGRIGNSVSSIESFTKAISINPNDALAYFNRATEKLIVNDKQGAIEDLSVCIKIDSTNINTYFLLTETMLELKYFDNAIKILDKVISLDKNNPKAYYLRGKSKLETKMRDDACSDLRKAGELGYYSAYELITKNCIKKEKKKSKK